MVEALALNAGLTTLSLGWNTLGDAWAAALAQALQANAGRTLTTLKCAARCRAAPSV